MTNKTDLAVMACALTDTHNREKLLIVAQAVYLAGTATPDAALQERMGWSDSDPDLLVPHKPRVDVWVRDATVSTHHGTCALRVGHRLHAVWRPRRQKDEAVPMRMPFAALPRWHRERVRWAGTYDAAWQQHRAPMLPLDFDPKFYNCAPHDQQLDGYVSGEPLRLDATDAWPSLAWILPAWQVPVTCVAHDGVVHTYDVIPDTLEIVIQARALIMRGRIVHCPSTELQHVTDVVIGQPTESMLARWRTLRDVAGVCV